ncbi:hypothetical protein HPULCUR_009531 [Helicostylum pulchrum]|uniref:Uncharacterized protein n=1 Tax=Helicostylum pulchrum TaxID=562976 RepID=A0ABP9YAP3_9FUNG
MYWDREPPSEDHRGRFPTLDTVTVANCWYYLSLLERFVNVTSHMSDKVLKMYLVRAEYRYFRWIANVGNRQRIYSLPPLDVAFFWQAHMLSPFRFYEDTLRVPPFESDRILLKEIHDFQTSRDPHILAEWKRFMKDENYDLTEEVIEKNEGNASIRCVVCNMRMEVTWYGYIEYIRDAYTEWRTDHSIALQCHCCGVMFTIKHVGKANLLADNAARRRASKTAGLLLNINGLEDNRYSEHDLLLPLKGVKSLPFNEGLGPLEDLLKTRSRGRPNFERSKKNLVNALQSTYLCTPYRAGSIDMIQAVARQYKFAVKATKVVNWNAPDGIVKGIRHYANFLAIIHGDNSLVAVPTYEIDLAWHTHMLSHLSYRTFCYKVFRRLINHDDTISEEKLKDHVKRTDVAWKQRGDTRVFSNLPDLPLSRPGSRTDPEIERKEAEMAEKAKKEKKSIKKKIRRFMSFKKKKAAVELLRPILDVNPFPRKIHYAEEALFPGDYHEGTYEPSYKYISKGAYREKTEDGEEENEESEENSGRMKEDCKNEEFAYDKEEISFHDKRDIKDFVKLNNSDSLMDLKFKEIKESYYGFIGGKASNLGDVPVYSSKGLKNIPELEKSNRSKKYSDVYGSQNTHYNTAGDNFNWYNISVMWHNSLVDCSKETFGDCGGLSNCGTMESPTSMCAGITASCGGDGGDGEGGEGDGGEGDGGEGGGGEGGGGEGGGGEGGGGEGGGGEGGGGEGGC